MLNLNRDKFGTKTVEPPLLRHFMQLQKDLLLLEIATALTGWSTPFRSVPHSTNLINRRLKINLSGHR